MGTVNLKSNLGYVVTKRRGSVTELEEKNRKKCNERVRNCRLYKARVL